MLNICNIYSGIGVCLQLEDHQRIENEAMMKRTAATAASTTQKLNSWAVKSNPSAEKILLG